MTRKAQHPVSQLGVAGRRWATSRARPDGTLARRSTKAMVLLHWHGHSGAAQDLYGVELDEALDGDGSVTFEDMRVTRGEAGLEMLDRLDLREPSRTIPRLVVRPRR